MGASSKSVVAREAKSLENAPGSKPTLHIQFDANQDYQNEAVRAIVDLFDGLDREEGAFALAGDEIIGNLPEQLSLDRSWLLSNLQDVQERRGIERSLGL